MNNDESSKPVNRLEQFPVSFFSIVMGLSGFTIAWQKAGVADVNVYTDSIMPAVTSLVFVALLVIYFSKILRFNQQVLAELRHPIKLNFFPAISISVLLLSISMLNQAPGLAHGLWVAGSILQLLLTLFVVNSWMHHGHFKIQHMNPAWFIPAVGNVLVPIAGMSLGYTEVSWFFFSVGMMFWVILFTIVFNRVLFHDPLPEKLVPTFFILIAPPAVGFISYMKLTGTLDSFAHMLYYMALFLTLLLLSQVKIFARLQFFLSWWAYSFPVAAITIASFVMHKNTGHGFFLWLASGLLIVLSCIIVLLLIKTSNAIRSHSICVEE
jgi:tellurite resistance protein